MKLLALGLASLLLLTGCGSSSSLGDQVKLLEYEKCISTEEAVFTALIQNRTREELQSFFEDLEKEDPLVNEFIEKCANYRP